MILHRARLRLTISFALVQLALVAAFAVSVYVFVASAFDYDAAPEPGSISSERGLELLRVGLSWSFAALVMVAPITSWLLAGLALRPVRETFEAQQRFVDDASHELRTPLSAARTELELAVSRRREASEYRTAIGRALSSLDSLQATLTDLLALSRSRHAVLVDDVDVGELVRGISGFFPQDEARLRAAASDGLTVRGSAPSLRRVLINLVDNALRYSEAGAPVDIRALRHGRFVSVEIEDRGVGMTRSQSRRAFDRFWQADSSRVASGSGLGLAMVRDIVRRHRGSVSLHSHPRTGTLVRVRIPFSRSSHEPVRSVEDVAAHGRPDKEKKQWTSGS